MFSYKSDWRVFIAGALLSAAVLLSGCKPQQPAFHSLDVTGADYARDWAMPDAQGTIRTREEFAGKVVYIFFGFTHCPEVCPTTLFEMAELRKSLGSDADKFQIIFVTVDPARDTPELMRTYLDYFDSQAIALVGNAEQLADMAKEFKVFYQKVPGESDDDYTMDHSAGGYIFDTKGKLRLYTQYETPVKDVADDIKRLLRERKP